MSAVDTPAVPRQVGRVLPAALFGKRSWHVVERNVLVYRRIWKIFLTGFLEPILFLLSIGIGVGGLVGKLPAPGGGLVPYDVYVAPGLMAAAAMNGAVLDTTFNFFVRYKYAHTYDAMLATPLDVGDIATGEVVWALVRGTLYATGFLLTMVAMGLVRSPWCVLAIPGSVLIGFAFAGAGLGATTYMRSFVDFDFVNLAIIPLFLFSATFFPLSRYPDALQWVVRATPLYQGVMLERRLTLGAFDWTLLGHVAYLVAMGGLGMRVASRRLHHLLNP